MTQNEYQEFMKDMLVRLDGKVDLHGQDLAAIKESLKSVVTKEECQKTRVPAGKGISWVAGNKRVFIPLAAIAAVGAAVVAVIQAL